MVKFTPALALLVCLASASALRAQEITKPLGKWERQIGKSHVTLIVEDNRLHATFIGEKACVLHADYAMTRDGVVFGVITSIDCEEDEDGAKAVFDAPFSCRFRIDEGALIVHDLKCHEVDSKDDVWNGRFKPVSAAPSRAAVVPTSYPPMPVGTSMSYWPSSSNANNSPSPAPQGGGQNFQFQFWPGFIR